ncbi:hypothetical protein EDEG_02673 [Edhazardia aedis USNM 41457]|uniref:Uncharacterized protein n=1 Tax=Edhazardia aedis (strain USNM 41457) TaxID=1003232 RepID=J9D5X3_EDHAE|nr:hypothetical protein EDEG_02673 [Edhazardia aedis USNM 41457]|eukprot:EJW02944.1 hypothetical protein EDEG_02673 [Edhazardia aedis USNM 41457]
MSHSPFHTEVVAQTIKPAVCCNYRTRSRDHPIHADSINLLVISGIQSANAYDIRGTQKICYSDACSFSKLKICALSEKTSSKMQPLQAKWILLSEVLCTKKSVC